MLMAVEPVTLFVARDRNQFMIFLLWFVGFRLDGRAIQ